MFALKVANLQLFVHPYNHVNMCFLSTPLNMHPPVLSILEISYILYLESEKSETTMYNKFNQPY